MTCLPNFDFGQTGPISNDDLDKVKNRLDLIYNNSPTFQLLMDQFNKSGQKVVINFTASGDTFAAVLDGLNGHSAYPG